MSSKPLKIRGAKEHNLKNIDLELPHNQLTVITGLSGAGKSTLAFDTIHAEGQQRYVETFSTYTRQFLERVKKPDVDLIENVRPSIAIEQKTRIFNSRSTVGSLTDINDYLALLWSQLSEPACSTCGISLRKPSQRELVKILNDLISSSADRSEITLLVKIKINQKKFKAELARLQQLGFSRIYNEATQQIEKIDFFSGKKSSSLYLALERFRTPTSKIDDRLTNAVRQAFNFNKDLEDIVLHSVKKKYSSNKPWLIVTQAGANSLQKNNSNFRSLLPNFSCGKNTFEAARPRSAIFSWSNPLGACSNCKGFGKIIECDPSLVIPNELLTIAEGAVQCWTGEASKSLQIRLLKFCLANGINTNTSWKNLSSEHKELIFNCKTKGYVGIRPWFKTIEKKSYKVAVRTFLARYRSQFDCPTCNNKRLKEVGLSYFIDSYNIADFLELDIRTALSKILNWQKIAAQKIAEQISLKDIFNILIARLSFLSELGLGYLTLNRQAKTLSGGETQRVSLASALGSELVSTQFVLDEPTVGLHPRDTEALVKAIHSLKDKGNTVIVVEHDPDFIRQADQIIELGPQAGADGGEVSYQGDVANWSLQQITPHYEFSKRPVDKKKSLKVINANARNILNLNTEIAYNSFTCLTGVSGSGKSTLIEELILKNYERYKTADLQSRQNLPIQGFEYFEQVLLIDQLPIGKTPRANIATYCGFWERIRILLSKTELAQQLKLNKSHFSFNVDGGRCSHCKGSGFIRENMQFLSDVFLPCEFCLGERFSARILQVKYRGLSVSKILKATINDCRKIFYDEPQIVTACEILSQLGLDHLQIGHSLSELSGGEAQRLKLIPFFQRISSAHNLPDSDQGSLIILDEPTTGLHVRDIEKLLTIIQRLVECGHTVVCVEHNPLVILSADHIIDLGPDAGSAGGKVVATGSPKDLIKKKKSDSLTVKYLQDFHKFWSNQKSKKENTTQLAAKASVAKNDIELEIMGARENNLKNINLKIPYNKIIALTGISGSGKSTLARGIIHAEGQRRYLDCLSPYARQFVTELQKPELDQIKNIAPTICVQQHVSGLSKISTIATVSEIYSYLRLLLAKVGQLYCPEHPESAISAFTAKELREILMTRYSENIRILAPIIKSKKGNHRGILENALSENYAEVRIDGKFFRNSQISKLELERNKTHSIDFVVGRFNPNSIDVSLVEECLAQAFSLGAGTLIVCATNGDEIFSQERSCPICKKGFLKPDPEDLSFSSARGRCDKCQGSGINKNGLLCETCKGSRLNEFARSIKIKNKHIGELTSLRPQALANFLQELRFTDNQNKLAEQLIFELNSKLKTLIDLGLDLLPLNRDCRSLSGGELQRLRLAAALGTPLNGVLYILDEPSANLHPDDLAKVLLKIEELKKQENSVLLIEHDLDCISFAEQIIEIGPGAGNFGGQVVFDGSRDQFLNTAKTITADYLRTYQSEGVIRRDDFSAQLAEKQLIKNEFLKIVNSSCNNIRNINLNIPLKSLTVVAGVSGSGKSSLVNGIILNTILEQPGETQNWQSNSASLAATIKIDKVMSVDQKPIGSNSRSTPASYLGILDHLRKVFANTLEAKTQGYSASYFSYNSGQGRCTKCKGLGEIRLEMNFLPDAHVLCSDCAGLRYQQEILNIKYLGINFAELLTLSISSAKEMFMNHRQIYEVLKYACDLGLGYLKLGQSSNTLSGGESQRLKLAIELAASKKAHNLYILDEPSIGLHPADLGLLISVLKTLVNQGHTVIVIEHDLQMLQAADHLIELGPGSAENGGTVVFEGTFQNMPNTTSPWAQFLQNRIKQKLNKKSSINL